MSNEIKAVQVRLDEENSAEVVRVKAILKTRGIKMSDANFTNLLVTRGFPSVLAEFNILTADVPASQTKTNNKKGSK